MNKSSEPFRGRALVACIFCGAVGGAAPTLLDLAAKARIEQLPGGGYYLAMAIFAFLGAFLAAVYKEIIPHKAFFLGVGAPALIVAGGKAVDTKTALNFDPSALISVYAQDKTTTLSDAEEKTRNMAQNPAERQVFIVLSASSFPGKVVEVRMQLNVTAGDEMAKVSVSEVDGLPAGVDLPAASAFTGLGRVPGGIDRLGLKGFAVIEPPGGSKETVEIQSRSVALPAYDKDAVLVIDRKKPFWSGFFEALGMRNYAESRTEFPISVLPLDPVTDR